MIERVPILWAARGWMARRMEGPRVYSAIQRAVGSHAVWTRFVTEILRPAAGMRVLDVGCGPADVLGFLPADVRYLGIDLHPPYIEAARARHGARGDFRVTPIAALTTSFDVVLFAGLLHHLDDAEARAVIRAAAARLAPSGRIVALEPLRAPGQGFIERQAYMVDRGRFVRDAAGYARLFEGVAVQGRTWPRALRLPYTYTVLETAPTLAGLKDHL